jgi:hypothetical protein
MKAAHAGVAGLNHPADDGTAVNKHANLAYWTAKAGDAAGGPGSGAK